MENKDIENATSRKKILVGKVVSDKMDKTIVVVVERRLAHPVYKKYRTIRKKFKAHDEKNDCRMGDLVRIIEHRPISREKRWNLLSILQRQVE